MKKLFWIIFAGAAILNCGLAHADSITGYITGDNNISYWNGTSWVLEGTNFKDAETLNLNITQSTDEIYFAVSNNPGNLLNPAGLLASFTDTDGTFTVTGTNTLLSNSATFQVEAVNPWTTNPNQNRGSNPPSSLNPTDLTGWSTPKEYGKNLGLTFWSIANLGPIKKINDSSQWLWTNEDNGDYSRENDFTIFEVNLGVTDGSSPLVTPEPPTVLLFAFAGALVMFFNRKKILNSVKI